MERRRDSGGGPPSEERRRGDRRRAQAPTLQFRRATDRRLEGTQYEALLARRALEQRVRTQPPAPEPVTTVDLVPRVVDLTAPAPATAACPECGQECDPLWLVRHWVTAHPS